jgi:hypothetical protein
MKQIRHSVFETNSSSTHSISISEEVNTLDSLLIDNSGVATISGQEFGWEEETYSDAESKAAYAMIYAHEWAGDDKERYITILTDVIKQQTGAKEVVFNFSGGWSSEDGKPWGYIDHQSVEDRDLDYLFEEPGKLRNFIFNPASILHTDNDNH